MEYRSDILNVAVINFKVKSGDIPHNLNKIKDFTISASKRGADIILFPELCLAGYDIYIDKDISKEEKIALSEVIPGPSTQAIANLASQYGVYIVFGMAERESEQSDKLYNSAVAIGPEGILGTYRKIHPFDLENTWCSKGDTPFMFNTKWGPISIGICYDTYQFPELMRYYVSKGSRLYLNPTALIEEYTKPESRTAFKNYYVPTLEYGVLSNTIYIASANLVGFDKKNYFGGGSVVIGPKISPFFETDCTCYGGDYDCYQEKLFITTIDLSLSTRRLCSDETSTGTPDYRSEIYKKF